MQLFLSRSSNGIYAQKYSYIVYTFLVQQNVFFKDIPCIATNYYLPCAGR